MNRRNETVVSGTLVQNTFSRPRSRDREMTRVFAIAKHEDHPNRRKWVKADRPDPSGERRGR
jgi:hypothetical protein